MATLVYRYVDLPIMLMTEDGGFSCEISLGCVCPQTSVGTSFPANHPPASSSSEATPPAQANRPADDDSLIWLSGETRRNTATIIEIRVRKGKLVATRVTIKNSLPACVALLLVNTHAGSHLANRMQFPGPRHLFSRLLSFLCLIVFTAHMNTTHAFTLNMVEGHSVSIASIASRFRTLSWSARSLPPQVQMAVLSRAVRRSTIAFCLVWKPLARISLPSFRQRRQLQAPPPMMTSWSTCISE